MSLPADDSLTFTCFYLIIEIPHKKQDEKEKKTILESPAVEEGSVPRGPAPAFQGALCPLGPGPPGALKSAQPLRQESAGKKDGLCPHLRARLRKEPAGDGGSEAQVRRMPLTGGEQGPRKAPSCTGVLEASLWPQSPWSARAVRPCSAAPWL